MQMQGGRAKRRGNGWERERGNKDAEELGRGRAGCRASNEADKRETGKKLCHQKRSAFGPKWWSKTPATGSNKEPVLCVEIAWVVPQLSKGPNMARGMALVGAALVHVLLSSDCAQGGRTPMLPPTESRSAKTLAYQADKTQQHHCH